MALSTEQLVTIAEIAQETDAFIQSKYSSLNLSAERETRLSDDIDLWGSNHNDVDVWLSGQDVNYQIRELLNDIRSRTRKAFGLPLYSEEVCQSSGAVANRFIF